MTDQQRSLNDNSNAMTEDPRREARYTLDAMCKQEARGYRCGDYLQRQIQEGVITREEAASCINNRTKMAQWCVALVDNCKLNRETISVAMSCLDRFLDTDAGARCINHREAFQLAVMTCFYSMEKISGDKVIAPETLSEISRGYYSKEDIETFERTILNAIQWRVSVPTPLAFVREFLKLIPETKMNNKVRHQVYTLAKLQTEMAIGDYSLVTVKASTIALAAILNVFQALRIDHKIVQQFIVSSALDDEKVDKIRDGLFVAIAAFATESTTLSGDVSAKHKFRTSSGAPRRRSYTTSPRTVCNQAA